jgi:hypothetical protein
MLGQFMSLGVLGEYAKSLYASSPCMHRFFLRILHVRIDSFPVQCTWRSALSTPFHVREHSGPGHPNASGEEHLYLPGRL